MHRNIIAIMNLWVGSKRISRRCRLILKMWLWMVNHQKHAMLMLKLWWD